jgi:predicted nucleotidyltransferase component of viral defense system
MKYIDYKIHENTMNEFLTFLYLKTDRFIFKGGTALYKFYKLDRFSEDLDFDSENGDISKIVKAFCKLKGFPEPSEKKNTNKGQKYFIDYGVIGQTLKIETSLRNKFISKDTVVKFDNILVYNIDIIAFQKADALRNRDKIRDLYDMAFIIINYYDKLKDETKEEVSKSLHSKGLKQYDYVIKEQQDEFINNEKMLEMVIKAFDIVAKE